MQEAHVSFNSLNIKAIINEARSLHKVWERGAYFEKAGLIKISCYLFGRNNGTIIFVVPKANKNVLRCEGIEGEKFFEIMK